MPLPTCPQQHCDPASLIPPHSLSRQLVGAGNRKFVTAVVEGLRGKGVDGQGRTETIIGCWAVGVTILMRNRRNKAGYTAISCGRVGRGGNACFPTFRLEHDGPTDGPTDRPTDGRTKPLIDSLVRY